MAPVKTAIVLCAGRGKRLSPHTDTTPKPLLPVGQKPTLDFIFTALESAGIEKIVLVTHYLADQIEAYAKAQTFFATEQVVCVAQNALSGTADAALAALDAKPEWFDSAFLLTASDYLVPQSFYKDLLQRYIEHDKTIAVSLKRIATAEMAMRSSVRFDEHGDVLEVVEKPAPGSAPSALSANLVYVLPSDIVEHIRAVPLSPRGEREIQTAVNTYLKNHGPGCSLEQPVPSEWHPDMR